MKNLNEQLRAAETTRIIEALKGMDHEVKETYLRANADALEYVSDTLKAPEVEKLERYIP